VVDAELWVGDAPVAVAEVLAVVFVVDAVVLLAAALAVVWLARSAIAAVPTTPAPASRAVTARARRRRVRRTRAASLLVRPVGGVGVGSTVMITSVGVGTQRRLTAVWELAENRKSSGRRRTSASGSLRGSGRRPADLQSNR
jgi:hypothetical protein